MKDLMKNMKHLQMLKVYKKEKPKTMAYAHTERRKNGCPQPLVSFILLYSFLLI